LAIAIAMLIERNAFVRLLEQLGKQPLPLLDRPLAQISCSRLRSADLDGGVGTVLRVTSAAAARL
jgi:hypothetical protein